MERKRIRLGHYRCRNVRPVSSVAVLFMAFYLLILLDPCNGRVSAFYIVIRSGSVESNNTGSNVFIMSRNKKG